MWQYKKKLIETLQFVKITLTFPKLKSKDY